MTEAGVEQAVPATKSFTTELAALAVLALGLGAPLDPAELMAVPDAISSLLAAPLDVGSIVDVLANVHGVVVSGRGLAYAAALELAIKLKEACYLHAMGLSYADLLHGPIAVVDAQTPAIVVAADSGPTLAGTIDLARRVTGAGASAFGIGGGAALAEACTLGIAGPAPSGVAGAYRPDRARAAGDRGAGAAARHQSGPAARPVQGDADGLTGLPAASVLRSGSGPLRRAGGHRAADQGPLLTQDRRARLAPAAGRAPRPWRRGWPCRPGSPGRAPWPAVVLSDARVAPERRRAGSASAK